MTPTEIMERVKLRFDVLYYSDEKKIEVLMADSMGKYQDKAGAVKTLEIAGPDPFITRPDDLLQVVASSDVNGRYFPVQLSDSRVTITGNPVYPVAVSYLVNFRELTLADDLPEESIGLIQEHFEASLNVRNTRLERNVAQASGLQRELPTEEALVAKVEAIEQAMEDAQAIIPIITVM